MQFSCKQNVISPLNRNASKQKETIINRFYGSIYDVYFVLVQYKPILIFNNSMDLLGCLGFWALVLNATFNNIQLYRGGQFYWWRKPEYPQKTTNPVPSHLNLMKYFLFSSLLCYNIAVIGIESIFFSIEYGQFIHKTCAMLGLDSCLSLQLFVGGLKSYLRYSYLFAYSGDQHILCYVFALFIIVLGGLCCHFLCTLHFCIASVFSRVYMF